MPTFTLPLTDNAGATLRAIAKAVERAASDVPDVATTGGEVALHIESPASTGDGFLSVQITGPYPARVVI